MCFATLEPRNIETPAHSGKRTDTPGVAVALEGHAYGREACIIGEVKAGPPGIVAMRTGFGGTRVVDTPVGERLIRIC